MRLHPLILLPLILACTPTAEQRVQEDNPEGEVTITPDELKPMREFVLDTRRVVVADFVKIELSQQFFQQQMGFTRDPRFVARSAVQVLDDGTRVLSLKNINTEQKTNVNPDTLPRVYFGDGGLEIRAFREIRIYMTSKVDKEQPLFIHVTAKSAYGDAQMYVTGRLQHERPILRLDSMLIWSTKKERYVHKASAG